MTKSNSDLIHDFAVYGETGKSSKMTVTESEDGEMFLWGYGWALYAYRTFQGRLYVYDGWEGYSSATTKHIRHFKSEHEGFGDYSVPKAIERIEEYADAQPGVRGSFGAKSFDADGREELQDYGRKIAP